MKSIQTKSLLLWFALIAALPLTASAQTTKPGMKKSTTRRAVTLVPVGTNLKVRLEDTLSSKDSRAGDKFSATVVDPSRFDEATVRGHIRSITKSGRIKGATTINLAFDSITLADGRAGTLHGYVTRVYDGGGKADEEGGVKSSGRGNQTVKRGAIGGTAGAIIGAIAGGGKGAAIGTIVGGAAGVGSVAMKGGKELKLESGTEMLVHVTR